MMQGIDLPMQGKAWDRMPLGEAALLASANRSDEARFWTLQGESGAYPCISCILDLRRAHAAVHPFTFKGGRATLEGEYKRRKKENMNE